MVPLDFFFYIIINGMRDNFILANFSLSFLNKSKKINKKEHKRILVPQ